MFLILAFLLCAVVWGFFHSNPRGVAAAATSGPMLYGDALIARPDERAMAVYLAIMAGGTAFMIVVAAGGLARNLLLFPLSSRSQA
jgi:hypothetical protein